MNVTKVALADGTEVLLRPIQPEDEPMWLELLQSCSKESIYSRFGFLFNWTTCKAAARFCHTDLHREFAIVAELETAGKRQLLGVGRLVADPDVDNVEYAVLVSDQWQNRGLGGLLTDHCLDIARRWGVKRIYAQTRSDNPRMIHVFQNREFEIGYDANGADVDVSLGLN